MFKSINQTSTVDAVHQQIRHLILTKELTPGSRLPTESELVKEMGVSRPALREAVRMLVGEGLLEVIHGRGTFVCEVTSASAIHGTVLQILIQSNELTEILEVRQILEPEIAARAAVNASESDFEEIEAILKEIDRLHQAGQSLFEITWAFHRKLAELAGNTALAQIINILYEMIKEAQKPLYDQYFDPAVEVQEHRHLVEVLKKRDPESARQAMSAHISLVNERTTRVLE